VSGEDKGGGWRVGVVGGVLVWWVACWCGGWRVGVVGGVLVWWVACVFIEIHIIV